MGTMRRTSEQHPHAAASVTTFFRQPYRRVRTAGRRDASVVNNEDEHGRAHVLVPLPGP